MQELLNKKIIENTKNIVTVKRRENVKYYFGMEKGELCVVSARGFEPPAPGFIPLRLSSPCPWACSWSGLSLHHSPLSGQGVTRTVSTPSFQPMRKAWLGIGTAQVNQSVPRIWVNPPWSFLSWRPIQTLGILCSIQLSYADTRGTSYPKMLSPASIALDRVNTEKNVIILQTKYDISEAETLFIP